MSRWTVIVTREITTTDGVGEYQRTSTTTVTLGPPAAFDSEAEADAYAQRVRNAQTDPTIVVTVNPPAGIRLRESRAPLTDAEKATRLEGVRSARAALRGDK